LIEAAAVRPFPPVLALLLFAASPAGAAQRHHPAATDDTDMTLGPATRTAMRGCDNPTPVRAPDGVVYSNVSDCTPAKQRVSTGWERVTNGTAFVTSNVTTHGDGPKGPKMSGALVDGGTLYLIERNVTKAGGIRVGHSDGVAKPRVAWDITIPDFGWASFAQASPDNYQYIYLRDARTAYGPADRVDLVRMPSGSETELAAWQVFSGTPDAPAWVPWGGRSARTPVLNDPGKVERVHVSHVDGCWTMAVTVPLTSGHNGGNGLAVYTSANPYGPWNRRYSVSGTNLGESAQFSPLWPGKLLTTEGDHFTWRGYTMPAGC
jgi:hypothetical protein